jgi:hypothetical protein
LKLLLNATEVVYKSLIGCQSFELFGCQLVDKPKRAGAALLISNGINAAE